ncbi:Rcs stress response system protein RcsF [Thalassomonas sp. M1454]|uniref:Rcs stress response system protein RcsF n=1 Tax=Thalassomonas sp. M1454 TaxID=2594477 RepID=UPI00117F106E|nr:Rcs stress response system protein RcsF [Thalassomonas sp. M1454]TRX56337.1 rcsF protein [Thalassomonas sp. M1454]
MKPLNIINKFQRSYVIPLTILCLITACSSNVEVETNLDAENFENYFATGSVTVYQDENEFNGPSNFVGIVEGESCKAKENSVPANAADARTQARKKAAQLNANAVVFTSCTLIEDQQCLEMMVCYGKAYQVVDKQ